jgi:hypothetical protein
MEFPVHVIYFAGQDKLVSFLFVGPISDALENSILKSETSILQKVYGRSFESILYPNLTQPLTQLGGSSEGDEFDNLDELDDFFEAPISDNLDLEINEKSQQSSKWSGPANLNYKRTIKEALKNPVIVKDQFIFLDDTIVTIKKKLSLLIPGCLPNSIHIGLFEGTTLGFVHTVKGRAIHLDSVPDPGKFSGNELSGTDVDLFDLHKRTLSSYFGEEKTNKKEGIYSKPVILYASSAKSFEEYQDTLFLKSYFPYWKGDTVDYKEKISTIHREITEINKVMFAIETFHEKNKVSQFFRTPFISTLKFISGQLVGVTDNYMLFDSLQVNETLPFACYSNSRTIVKGFVPTMTSDAGRSIYEQWVKKKKDGINLFSFIPGGHYTLQIFNNRLTAHFYYTDEHSVQSNETRVDHLMVQRYHQAQQTIQDLLRSWRDSFNRQFSQKFIDELSLNWQISEVTAFIQPKLGRVNASKDWDLFVGMFKPYISSSQSSDEDLTMKYKRTKNYVESNQIDYYLSYLIRKTKLDENQITAFTSERLSIEQSVVESRLQELLRKSPQLGQYLILPRSGKNMSQIHIKQPGVTIELTGKRDQKIRLSNLSNIYELFYSVKFVQTLVTMFFRIDCKHSDDVTPEKIASLPVIPIKVSAEQSHSIGKTVTYTKDGRLFSRVCQHSGIRLRRQPVGLTESQIRSLGYVNENTKWIKHVDSNSLTHQDYYEAIPRKSTTGSGDQIYWVCSEEINGDHKYVSLLKDAVHPETNEELPCCFKKRHQKSKESKSHVYILRADHDAIQDRLQYLSEDLDNFLNEKSGKIVLKNNFLVNVEPGGYFLKYGNILGFKNALEICFSKKEQEIEEDVKSFFKSNPDYFNICCNGRLKRKYKTIESLKLDFEFAEAVALCYKTNIFVFEVEQGGVYLGSDFFCPTFSTIVLIGEKSVSANEGKESISPVVKLLKKDEFRFVLGTELNVQLGEYLLTVRKTQALTKKGTSIGQVSIVPEGQIDDFAERYQCGGKINLFGEFVEKQKTSKNLQVVSSDIDMMITTGTKALTDGRQTMVDESRLFDEGYQRFKLEVSELCVKKKEFAKNLEVVLNSNVAMDQLKRLIEEYFILNETMYTNYTDSNIRVPCSMSNENSFCDKTKGKFKIPKEFYTFYCEKFIHEMRNVPIVRSEVFQTDGHYVSVVIDREKFTQRPNQTVFELDLTTNTHQQNLLRIEYEIDPLYKKAKRILGPKSACVALCLALGVLPENGNLVFGLIREQLNGTTRTEFESLFPDNKIFKMDSVLSVAKHLFPNVKWVFQEKPIWTETFLSENRDGWIISNV